MTTSRTGGKIISLFIAVALVFGIFAGMPISVRAEDTPIGLSGPATPTQLPAPTNPHWDSDTGYAVWDNVIESGVGNDVSYHWILYRDGQSESVAENGIDSNDNVPGDFRVNLSTYLPASGNYYFKVKAVGDQLNYTDSDYSAESDRFNYVQPTASLDKPIDLEWKQEGDEYYATWGNLKTADYADEDSFTVRCYNWADVPLAMFTWTKEDIIDANVPGIPMSSCFAAAYDKYYFRVVVNSSRPLQYRSSEESENSPLLTIGTPPVQPPIYPGNNGGSSSRGSSRDSSDSSSSSSRTTQNSSNTSSTSSTPAPVTQTASDIKTLVSKADGNSVRSKGKGEVTIEASAWKELGNKEFNHDTVIDGKVQVRVTIQDPKSINKDLKVSAYISGKDVEKVEKIFNKHFSNTTAVVHFDQTGSWGQEVKVAAKVDLSKMNKDNLVFYAYDKAKNSYDKITNPNYWIDSNGYLHFSTSMAGDIIVSDGPLTK